MARSILIALLYGFTVCSAAPRKVVELNDIPKVQLSGDGVSTSFGGYHASAGLGGSLDGGPAGGLFAEAGTPDGTGASAGLGGSVGSRGVHFSQAGFGDGTASESDSFSSSSAGAGNHVSRPNKRPAEFYDNIFNIPISVLQAVNQLLGGAPANGGSKAVHTRASAISSSVSSAHTAGEGNGSADSPRRTFFDDVFNIPISALKSVNELLNSKNHGGTETRKTLKRRRASSLN